MRASPGVRDHPPNLPRDPHSSAPSGCHSRRRELERLDLHEFEVAQLGNLLPEEVDEARMLIPSLSAEKVASEQLKEVLEQLQTYRSYS